MDGHCDLLLIRHAPTATPGRLAGRSDVAAVLPPAPRLARLRRLLGMPDRLWVSPARRCLATAEALFPGLQPMPDPRLWEQDFGAWEGQAAADLPDPGPLDRSGLAALRPPGGESFAELFDRTAPALRAAVAEGGRVAVVAHAGTVRAALGLALGEPAAGLAFQVDPLGVTCLRAFPGSTWAVQWVNRT